MTQAETAFRFFKNVCIIAGYTIHKEWLYTEKRNFELSIIDKNNKGTYIVYDSSHLFELSQYDLNGIPSARHSKNVNDFPEMLNIKLPKELLKLCKSKTIDIIQNSKEYKDYVYSIRGKTAASNLGLLESFFTDKAKNIYNDLKYHLSSNDSSFKIEKDFKFFKTIIMLDDQFHMESTPSFNNIINFSTKDKFSIFYSILYDRINKNYYIYTKNSRDLHFKDPKDLPKLIKSKLPYDIINLCFSKSFYEILDSSEWEKYMFNRRGKDAASNLGLLESSGSDYLNKIISITHGKQKEFYEWELKNSKEIQISKTPSNIDICKPKVKACYENSFFVTISNENLDVKYVEGMAFFMGIPIDHAWNKIGDTYFDVTSEGPLKNNSKFTEYISLLELSSKEVTELALKSGASGPFISDIFRKLK